MWAVVCVLAELRHDLKNSLLCNCICLCVAGVWGFLLPWTFKVNVYIGKCNCVMVGLSSCRLMRGNYAIDQRPVWLVYVSGQWWVSSQWEKPAFSCLVWEREKKKRGKRKTMELASKSFRNIRKTKYSWRTKWKK